MARCTQPLRRSSWSLSAEYELTLCLDDGTLSEAIPNTNHNSQITNHVDFLSSLNPEQQQAVIIFGADMALRRRLAEPLGRHR